MDEARGRAPGGAVGKIEIDLDDAMSGADGVDRDADLHAEAGGERENVVSDPARSAR